MGISDKVWFKLTCPKCGVTEVASSSDKGSTWGGPSWNSLTPLNSFSLQSIGGGNAEPEIAAARCTACNVTARVESSYGLERPAGF